MVGISCTLSPSSPPTFCPFFQSLVPSAVISQEGVTVEDIRITGQWEETSWAQLLLLSLHLAVHVEPTHTQLCV